MKEDRARRRRKCQEPHAFKNRKHGPPGRILRQISYVMVCMITKQVIGVIALPAAPIAIVVFFHFRVDIFVQYSVRRDSVPEEST